MAVHNDRGKEGERLARLFLIKKGFKILEKNWRHARAEIDLIAADEEELIFIEVKTRTSVNFGLPEDCVDRFKQQRLAEAAEAYVQITGFKGDLRFDIISILLNPRQSPLINHIENAFWPE